MSGKYAKKKKSGGLLRALILLAVVLGMIAVLWLLASGEEPDMPIPSAPEDTTAAPEASTSTAPIVATEAPYTFEPELEGVDSFSLDGGLEISRYGKYIGLYMEDGSDEFVENVMMILVENTGSQAVQYAKITLSGPSGDAVFTLTTLLPGQSIVVLEAERKPYSDTDIYTEAELENVALFSEMPGLMEDRIQIQPLEGGFNISNISGGDITGEIAVYFKDVSGETLYGGITYVTRIDGLAAGEVKQIMSANFTEKGSRVVFVKIAE